MPRRPRLVLPGHPHHVVQRGVRRMRTFFTEGDYRHYVLLMETELKRNGVACWAWCLMPNHVHWLLVPSDAEGLSDAMRDAHRLYALRVNRRNRWRGHMWENRFWSYVLAPSRMLNCVRYIEQNPVRARMVQDAASWPWSSASAHLAGVPDSLTDVQPVLDLVGDYESFLRKPIPAARRRDLERHLRTGRPWGSPGFVRQVALLTGQGWIDPSQLRRGATWTSNMGPLDLSLPPVS